MLRAPAVAGRFYPADSGTLRAAVTSYLSPAQTRVHAIACIAPHAGYMYSGQIAGAVFSRIEIPRRCIVLGPNHTGRGHPLAIMDEGEWQTPLGNISLDSDLATQLLDTVPALAHDSAAHQAEHAIEVELPFLQVVSPGVKFVPIAVGTSRLMVLEQLGESMAEVILKQKDPVLIIASSDMNHYEDDATTRVKDRKAIDKILALDPQGLHETVINESISMCGFAPTVAMLAASRKLDASKAELVQYATSGDVNGERDMVVGYAGILVT